MKLIKYCILCVGVMLAITGCENGWFDIGDPDIAEGDIDLDTTYFPFGLGYEWCYERHNWGWREPEYPEDTNTTWSDYDTFLVSVIDSCWNSDTLCFQLQGGFIDMTNPVKLSGAWINVSLDAYTYSLDTMVNIANPETLSIGEVGLNGGWGFDIEYVEDSLKVSGGCDYNWESCSALSSFPGEGESKYTSRIKGIGVVCQSLSFGGPWYSNDTYDRLLFFYNGSDTIYKAPDWEG